jgi:hypothetical protein
MKTFCLNRGKFNEGNKIVPLSRFPIHARNDFCRHCRNGCIMLQVIKSFDGLLRTLAPKHKGNFMY